MQVVDSIVHNDNRNAFPCVPQIPRFLDVKIKARLPSCLTRVVLRQDKTFIARNVLTSKNFVFFLSVPNFWLCQ